MCFEITIYLLVARIYEGELSTLPGIYFPECFRDFFDEISSRAQARGEISSSRENTRESKFQVKYSSPEAWIKNYTDAGLHVVIELVEGYMQGFYMKISQFINY